MPKNPWSLLLKAAGAFLLGLAVWAGLSQPYARVLAAASQSILRLSERPDVSTITANGTLVMVGRSDVVVSRSSGRFAVETTDLTFNVILLMTLFGASRRAVSDRNVFGLAAAAALLVLVHIAAVVAYVKAYYATSFAGEASFASKFWEATPFFYSTVGAYGFALALWWLFRPPSDVESSAREPRRVRARATAT